MKKLPLKLLVVSAIAATFITPATLQAKLPAKCINRLISKSEYKLQDIISTAQKGGRIENAYNNLRRSVTDFMQYTNSNWTKECLNAAPDNLKKYQQFMQSKAQSVLSLAMSRKNQLCSKAAEDLINTSMLKIQEKLKTDSATSYIREFENRLKNNSMIVNCAPVKDRVASMLNEEIPNIKKNIKVGKYISALSWESLHVRRIFEESQKAFKTKTLAPLGSSQSNLDFKNTLKSCLTNIKALDNSGYAADGFISAKGKNKITFADAKKACEDVEKYGVDKLLAEIKKNNENYAKEWKALWEKKHILGSAMQRTYKENHTRIPAKTEDLGTQIIWTYQKYVSHTIFSECKTYSFSKDGEKLLALHIYACE
jgi:tetrahydromethanopterin S-methyltransferase subunit B